MTSDSVELIAYQPPLRSALDLEPGWWFMRVQDGTNAADWFMVLLTGNTPMLHIVDTLGATIDPASLALLLAQDLESLLVQDGAGERVQIAGPIQPPKGDA